MTIWRNWWRNWLAWRGQPEEAEARGAARVRTMLVIRWVGILGQAAALAVVIEWLGFSLPVTDCIAVTLASVLVNLHLILTRDGSAWLTQRQATAHLGFDLIQLSALLYLTGGLENPFAMMIVVPVTVSATILPLSSTVMLALGACALETLLALYHRPLPWTEPGLVLPQIYVFGVWVALMSTTAFIAAYAWRVANEARGMSTALEATRMALAREQRAAALGALAAAAAHELGSPLGTIAVVAKELIHDVPADSPWRDDIELLISQSNRCRDILAQLSTSPNAEGDTPFGRPPLTLLLQDIADGILTPRPIRIVAAPDGDSVEPLIRRQAELLHGIGNFVSNAAQFTTTQVTVTAAWNDRDVTVIVADDGPGYPQHLLSRLGEPYISTRPGQDGHMGLGVFIGTTLLGHTGATVSFANRATGGAQVVIRWKRAKIEVAAAPHDAHHTRITPQ